ncbi:MAG: hypothetical protein FD181_1025 [Prolixibacteraceae bacterium]|nr:MAG: hypothetical protein FD181_1025 [Prolixibacteraceae bacterium]
MSIDKLRPKNITDIIFRLDEYLDYMREHMQEASALINYLDNYIKDYFQAKLAGESELKELTVKIVDELYKRNCLSTTGKLTK